MSNNSALGATHRLIVRRGLSNSRRDIAIFADLECGFGFERLQDVFDFGQTALATISNVDRLFGEVVIVRLLVDLERLSDGASPNRRRKVALESVIGIWLLESVELVSTLHRTKRHLAAFIILIIPLLHNVGQKVLLVLFDLLNLGLVELTGLLAVCLLVDGEEGVRIGFLEGSRAGVT